MANRAVEQTRWLVRPTRMRLAASLRVAAPVVLFGALAVACGAASAPAGQCPCTCASASPSVATASSAPPEPVASASVLPSGSATANGNPESYTPHELAGEHADAARVKASARDGAGCLAELDRHDKLDPRHLSTDPKQSYVAFLRAQCLMLSGKCTAGRDLLRKSQQMTQGMSAPEQIDKLVDVIAGTYCEGGDMTPRDRFLRARMDLTNGAWTTKKDAAFCSRAYKTMWSLRGVVVPRDDDDTLVKDPLLFLLTAAPSCLARAGDCDAAFATYKEVALELYKGAAWSRDDKTLRRNFEAIQPKCRP